MRFLISALLALGLTACSAASPEEATTSTAAPTSSATAPSPAQTIYSVPADPSPEPEPEPEPITALVDLPGADSLGLTDPVMSVRISHRSLWDEHGVTSMEPAPDGSSIDVVRYSWSGAEAWRRTFRTPEGDVVPYLSIDSGLGLASLWFTSDVEPTTSLSGWRPVVGDIHWFSQADGIGGIMAVPQGVPIHASEMLLGFVERDGDKTLRYNFMGMDHTLRQRPNLEDEDFYFPWGGEPLIYRTNAYGGLLQLGARTLFHWNGGRSLAFFHSPRALDFRTSDGEIWLHGPDGILFEAVDLCSVSTTNLWLMGDTVVSGRMVGNVQTGEYQCLEQLSADHRLLAASPDGWLFAESPLDADDPMVNGDVWMGKADMEQWHLTDLDDNPFFLGAHVVFLTYPDDETEDPVATSFKLEDFTPPE